MLYRLVSRLNGDQWLSKRGGIFILYADQINAEERTLLQTAARFLFKGERGNVDDQMPPYPIQVHHLPEFIPTRSTEDMVILNQEDPLTPWSTAPAGDPTG